MGVSANNSTGGRDYATDEYFFEFHRQIVVPKAVYDVVTKLLEAKKYGDAGKALKQAAPQNGHAAIDVFLGDLARAQGVPYP